MSVASGPLSVASGEEIAPTNSQGTEGYPFPPVKRRGLGMIGLLAALLSAGLLWLSHFPVSWGWLAWVALVPLLLLVRSGASAWKVYLSAWLAGVVCYGAALQWMRVADDRMIATWIALSLYCSLYWPAALWLLRWLDGRTGLPLTLTLPVVWTALEYFRASFGTGFCWYFLGHTQHDFLPLIQVSDLAGLYAVSFLIAACNGFVFELLFRLWRSDQPRLSRRSLILQASLVTALFIGFLIYGFWRLGQGEFAEGPRVALLQGNLDQRIRNDGENQGPIIFNHYERLTARAAAAQPRPDLIVWPETSLPGEWRQVSAELPSDDVPQKWRADDAEDREFARQLARRSQVAQLWGVNTFVLEAGGEPHRYNSALLVQADGELGPRYDKMVRVPFGEYVPFRETVPWLKQLAPYDYDYSISPGQRFTRFELYSHGQLYRFGVLICYEDSVATLAHQYARQTDDGPPVDFLVNVSNDGWFNGTCEHEEHLAVSRFRAVECRRAVLRAVNMGISAVIDGNGRVVLLPGPTWADSKKVAAVLTANVPIDERTSLYAQFGDWLPWLCWCIVGLALIGRRSRRSARFA